MHLPRVLCEAYLRMFSITSTGQEWLGVGGGIKGGGAIGVNVGRVGATGGAGGD